jgi:HlyD family secretion protein
VKKLVIAFVVVGLLAGAAAYYWAAHPRVPHYPTSSIEYGPIAEIVRGTGFVEIRNAHAVSAPVGGQVVEVHGDVGKVVKKGDTLLQIDKREAEMKLQAATASRTLAEKEVAGATKGVDSILKIMEQVETSMKRGTAVEMDLRKTEAELIKARAMLDIANSHVRQANTGEDAAKLQLELTTVKSPVDGIIIDRKVVVGQMAGPTLATPLFIIAPKLEEIRVLAQIAQADIARVLPNQKATISLFTTGDESVERTAIVNDTRLMPTQIPGAGQIPGSVFYSAVIDVENKEVIDRAGNRAWQFRPGMTADVSIYLRPVENAWKVPSDAVGLELEEQHLSDRAKTRLREWAAQNRPSETWKRIWVLEKPGEPWPVFIRVVNPNGERAIRDDQHVQVYEWDWGEGTKYAMNPADIDSLPPVIVNKPESTPSAIDRLLKSFNPTG